jgi:hypothetical protein
MWRKDSELEQQFTSMNALRNKEGLYAVSSVSSSAQIVERRLRNRCTKNRPTVPSEADYCRLSPP